MRTLTVVMTSILLLGLSGCQHIHLMNSSSTQNLPSAQHTPKPLTKLWTRHFGQTSIQDYPAACLGESKLNQPTVVGQVIDTPRYAMLTLAKQQQQAQVMGGELCILNKITHHIEITAVDDLRFITPTDRVTGNTQDQQPAVEHPTKP